MLINARSACLRCNLINSSCRRKISTTTPFWRTRKTYYEILGVKNDCTQKELKAAYIALSKVHHPDMSPNKSKEDKMFKEIVEAYQILSRSHSRNNYDDALKGVYSMHNVSDDIVHRPFASEGRRYSNVKDDPIFGDENYYGIKGVKKMPNWKIVLACAIFCGLGISLQYMLISKSLTFKREFLVQQSAAYARQHNNTRSQVSNSNDDNMERVLSRMVKNDDDK